MTFTTTTPVGTEGFNISYSTEKKCAESLRKILPEGWTVKFEWVQILFYDIGYSVDKKTKTVNVVYNQNLHIWWSAALQEIKKAF